MKEFEVPDTRPLVVKAKENKKTGLELPLTLGKPMPNTKEYDECMAMDSCIKNVFTGFRTDTMFSTMPMFVGYGMLSNVSQEALIRAGVETVADEMTRKFVRWTYHTDDGKENKEDLISKMDEQTKKYKLKEIFNEAMLKDGYFGGCLVYIDMGDLDDEEKEEPLILDKKTFKAGSFRGFKVIEPINIYPGWYNTNDPTDEYYFKPKFWYILGKKYHESRFLYFAGNEAPLLLKPTYNFFGIPQAQLALDYVAHFVANREAAQELLNKFSLTCWKTNMTQALKGHGCNDLVSRVRMFNRMKNNNGTMVLDKETEDMLQINTPLGGVRDIVEMSLNLLTAVWRIPKIKYLGEGEGGLNASSKEQMRSFYDYITSQQEKEFTHPMETVAKIFQLNLGLDINEALSFEFPPLVEMDDKERADLNKEQADRDAIYLANGVLSQEEVRKRLSMDKHSEYSMIDVDDMPEQPEAQPLGNVDKEEQEEEVKVANDGLVVDSFEGHAGRPGEVGGSLPKGSMANIPDYLIDTMKDYVGHGHSKVFKEDMKNFDETKYNKQMLHILENPVLDGWFQNKSLEEERKIKSEIFDHIRKNEFMATPETLMYSLYEKFDDQGSVDDIVKKFGLTESHKDEIKQMLNGLSINYPEFISYSDTYGLDVFTLKQSRGEKEEYYTIKLVDSNGDLVDAKTIKGSKNAIKEKYGNSVSSIQKETKKSRIEGAENIAFDGMAMDEFKEEEHPRGKDGKFVTKLKEMFSIAKNIKSHKNCMNRIKNFKAPNIGTYDFETGELKEYKNGYCVTFHQNEPDENGNFKSRFGRYTEKEYDDLTNEIAKKYNADVNIGYYDGVEISFWVKDKKYAIEIAEKYNQHSIWDCGAEDIILNNSYNKTKNPMEEQNG